MASAAQQWAAANPSQQGLKAELSDWCNYFTAAQQWAAANPSQQGLKVDCRQECDHGTAAQQWAAANPSQQGLKCVFGNGWTVPQPSNGLRHLVSYGQISEKHA